MTPQMIETLFYFMIAFVFKIGFEDTDMERVKEISKIAVIAIASKFIYLVYWQWQYLG